MHTATMRSLSEQCLMTKPLLLMLLELYNTIFRQEKTEETNLKQNEAQSARAESTNKGVN